MGIKLSKEGLEEFVAEVNERIDNAPPPRASTAPYGGRGKPARPKDSVVQLARALARDQALMERYVYDAAWVSNMRDAELVQEDLLIRIEARVDGLGLQMIESVVQDIVELGGPCGGYAVRTEVRVGPKATKDIVPWIGGRTVARKPDPISLVKVSFQEPGNPTEVL